MAAQPSSRSWIGGAVAYAAAAPSHPHPPLLVDFASHRAGTVIEVDSSHHGEEQDAPGVATITAEVYSVLHFWDNDVLFNREDIARSLIAELA